MTEKLRVLFVDDEPHILRGLRRSMTAMDDAWDMAFCESGAEALAHMEREPGYDVVVSDMRMSQMDGAEFLGIVRQRFPETIRVILSGYADAASILRTVGPAHLYLAKPCNAETLQAAINRPIALKRLLSAPALRSVLVGLTHLPSLPDLIAQLEEELRSPHCSAKSVADIVDRDVAMTAELLRLTNSAYFSVSGPASSPLQAVRVIGMETVQTLILQIGIFRQFRGSPAVAPLLTTLTDYSLGVAALADSFANVCGLEPDQVKLVHCAAMLSQIGILVLLDAFPEKYEALLQKINTGMPLHQAETEVFGASHTAVGAYLLGLWGFSPMVVEAVAYCCTPADCTTSGNGLLAVLHGALALGPPFPFPEERKDVQVKLDMRYLIEVKRDGCVSAWRRLSVHPSAEV